MSLILKENLRYYLRWWLTKWKAITIWQILSICKYVISSENWLKILNANPYFGTPLGEQETKDILTIGILMIYLGTVDEKGHANVHHTWYYYDPSNNKLYACSALNESPKISAFSPFLPIAKLCRYPFHIIYHSYKQIIAFKYIRLYTTHILF